MEASRPAAKEMTPVSLEVPTIPEVQGMTQGRHASIFVLPAHTLLQVLAGLATYTLGRDAGLEERPVSKGLLLSAPW